MNRKKLIESTIAVALGIFSLWMSIYTIGFSAALAIPQWLNGPMQSIGSNLSMFLWSLLVVYPLGVGLLILLSLWVAARFPVQNPRLFCLVFALTLCATHLIYGFWNGNGYSPLLILMWSSSYCIVVIAMVRMEFSLFRLGRD
ncbi:hypothetical protein [Microbulbifer sp. YPW1]|uniref:hypothetical protein n=1 Tax=Microbulbifer sp. YPW1 TaxID=2745199 RepID=UPI00159AD141|nr:hypothetical protein [Microbulbifer sp. YPW1]QKX16334.1 hypothetical protein HUW35_04655 [Microbulbifer sp. YPW1]